MKIAIIVDMAGTWGKTPEEEIEDLKKYYNDVILIPNGDKYFYTPLSPYDLQPGTQLVIYDFGGMLPGTSLMDDNAKEMVRWAYDNPTSLVIIDSNYTYHVYIKNEIQEMQENNEGWKSHNIILRDFTNFKFPEWWLLFNDILIEKVEPEIVEIENQNLHLKEEEISIDNKIEEPKIEKFIPPIVAYITLPVKREWQPGQKSGSARFKVADSIVDITEGEGEEEKRIASMGGAFFGFYEISFPDGKGDLWTYSISPKDFWPEFEKMHKELIEENKDC